MFIHKVSEILILSAPLLLLLLSLSISVSAESPKASTPATMVNSVLGPISADKLGTTLVHEHFAFAYPGWYADATMAPYDFKAVLKVNLEVMRTAQKYGITTIIDATTNDVGGRDPELFKTLARETGITIICSTGLYTENEGAPP